MKPQSSKPGNFHLLMITIILALVLVMATLSFPTLAQRSTETPEPPKVPEVVYGGDMVQSVSADATIYEGFESTTFPPVGWTIVSSSTLETWKSSVAYKHSGIRSAVVDCDPYASQDEVLISPLFTGTNGSLSFWSFGDLYWCRDTYDNCDLELFYVVGEWDGGSVDDVFLGKADDDWTASNTWSLSNIDISTYTVGTGAKIAFRYVGLDGATIGLDDVTISVTPEMNNKIYLPLTLHNYPPIELPEWTFMVFISGDGNQETAMLDDFLELASVGSSADVNIIAQLDRHPAYDTRFEDWTGAKRYKVENGMEPIVSSAEQDLGEVNMGDGAALVDFATWGITNYLADHYALVLWDPGKGVRTGSDDILDGVVFDQTSISDTLDMDEIQLALDTVTEGGIEPIDLLGLDAGLSAMIEVDAQVQPYIDLRVSSQDLEPTDGWPYDTVLSALVADPTQTPIDLATNIVDRYYAANGNDQTLSAVETGTAYETLISKVDVFSAALIDGIDSHYTEVQTARNSSQEFANPAYIDLYDFADQVSQQLPATAIYTAAINVMDAVSNTVINEKHGAGWPGAHGIGIYYPESFPGYNTAYDGSNNILDFTRDTDWDEWLQAYYWNSSACIIVNCDFELGGGVGWNETSTNGYDLITDTLDGSVLPHSGDWAAWLGGGNFNETSVIDQDITIPAVEHRLIFWYFLYGEEPCEDGTDRARILIDSNVVWEKKICLENSYWGWLYALVDLNPYIGNNVTLKIEATTVGSSEITNEIFIDDVYLIP